MYLLFEVGGRLGSTTKGQQTLGAEKLKIKKKKKKELT
jgi:hypothetical protein